MTVTVSAPVTESVSITKSKSEAACTSPEAASPRPVHVLQLDTCTSSRATSETGRVCIDAVSATAVQIEVAQQIRIIPVNILVR